MKRAALYVRVSTEEQRKHGLSVDSQIDALKAFCKAQGYNIQGIYNDAGISARKTYTKRPALLQLISACQNNEVDIILFTKLDRWFRSVKDYYLVMNELNNVPWKAIWEDYETETSAGIFKVNIMLSVAQTEADRTSERIRAVFEYKKSKGDYVGKVPFGYKRVNKRLVKDEETQDLVNLIFSTFLLTNSSVRTYRVAHEAGYNHTFKSFLNMLEHPAYSGGNGVYTCEPYLSEEQQYALKIALKNRIKDVNKTHDYMFSGICRCGSCGKKMVGHCQEINGKIYYRYVCNGFQSRLSHSNVISMSEPKLEKFLLSDLEHLIFEHNLEIQLGKCDDKIKEAQNRIHELENRKERVGIRFEMGDISADEYRTKITAIQKEMVSVQIPKSSKPVTIEANWRELYDKLDRDHKAMFWRSLIDYIVIKGKNHEPEVHFQ